MCIFRALSPPSSPRPPARTRSSTASGNQPRKQYQQQQQQSDKSEINNEPVKIGSTHSSTTSEQPNYVIHWPAAASSTAALQLNSEGFLCWHSISELNNDAGTSLNEVSTLTSAMHSEFKCIFTKNFVKLIMRKNDVKRSSSSCIEQ